LSALTARLPRMDPDDFVDPGDAALQELLACMAEHAHDVERRDVFLDYAMTVPPLAEWSTESLDALLETGRYIKRLARIMRELRELTGADEE
jgi:hypothetical protein